LPNKIGYLLGLSAKKLDQIIYYERYVIIQPGIKSKDGLNYMDFLTEEEYLDVLESIPYKNFLLSDSDNNKFIAKMGAEALEIILSKLDLDKLSIDLRYQISNNTSQQKKNDILKRLKIVESFRDSRDRIGNRPE
jgi:DNA-directed RNA polymerase subunit beta'|tara:strand:+ start:843 stop:1247 length:405 start_codon:yes stop_codon:yes gene_type:complete